VSEQRKAPRAHAADSSFKECRALKRLYAKRRECRHRTQMRIRHAPQNKSGKAFALPLYAYCV